jgi:Uma2 family endonuclease
MSPSEEHERFKKLIGRMIEVMTEELRIPIRSAGSTTWKDELKKHGLEPDECYYVANEPKVRGRDGIDLSDDPPPDLALEVELSGPWIEKMPIYADLGVPEVWCYDGESLRIMLLHANGRYAQAPRSAAFPFLPLVEIERFLARRNETDETSWIRGFREWVRNLTPP